MKKVILLVLIGFLFGCQKDADPPLETSTTINISHLIDGNEILSDTTFYATNHTYSVNFSRIEYYISGIEFLNDANEVIFTDDIAHYINGKNNNNTFILQETPEAKAAQMNLTIGLIPSLNISGGLPPTKENIGMAWPDMMGGGYHFLKLEGRYDNGADWGGYAFHLGTNGYQVKVEIPLNLALKEQNEINLNMNPIEWFQNPVDYDLHNWGSYTMGDTTLMAIVAQNGISTIKVSTE